MANRAPTVGRDEDALFVKDGVPVKFCFHKSVTQGRGRITWNVERHGGQIVPHERSTNVLLVDEQEDLALLRRRYYSSTELYRLSLYVEPRGFVQACIRAGTYRHAGPAAQGMPGRARGRGRGARRVRVPFTEEDRDHLAYYLATRCPTRDGRMGRSAYTDLERLGQTEDPSWAWARRHTHHSWREHYKMNPGMMDVRIDRYLQQLKDVGHHLGHDLRRHDHWNLRRELEEEEEEDEQVQGRGLERQDRERREQVCPVAAERRPAQAARDYIGRHEQDLVTLDEEEGDDVQEEVVIQEPQRVKRHRVDPGAHRRRDIQDTLTKRVRVSEASTSEGWASGVEAGREEGTNGEESQEIEGSDLFGDRTYDFNDDQEINFPVPFASGAGPVPEREGPPLSTQATLIASPRSAGKEPSPAPASTPTKVVGTKLKSTAPPSSQQTLVMTQERVIAQRARVRGASAQLGPPMPKETRTRGGSAAVDPPYRNTRARSPSVVPQPDPEPQLPRQREGKGGKGKGKAKQKEFASIEEDIHVEEEQREGHAEEDVGPVLVTVQESFEDEMAVEGLLEVSVEGKVDEESSGSEEGEHDKDDGISDEDEDEDSLPELPRFQDIEIEGEPSDSDDAETHASLVRSVVPEGSADEGDVSEGDQDRDQNEGDEDSEDDDADRIERMASGALHAAPAPTLPQARVTRSMAATQTRTGSQQISPRRTRSGNQARAARQPTAFPSPGTKAGAVVDRFREEGRRVPYAPPSGTRAAKAVKGRERRG